MYIETGENTPCTALSCDTHTYIHTLHTHTSTHKHTNYMYTTCAINNFRGDTLQSGYVMIANIMLSLASIDIFATRKNWIAKFRSPKKKTNFHNKKDTAFTPIILDPFLAIKTWETILQFIQP